MPAQLNPLPGQRGQSRGLELVLPVHRPPVQLLLAPVGIQIATAHICLLYTSTSGVLPPSLMKGIALAYLPVAHAKGGTELEIDVRGRKFPAVVVKKPFYKKG